MARDPPAKSIDPPVKRAPRDPGERIFTQSPPSSSYKPKSTSGGTSSTRSRPKFRRASTYDLHKSSRASNRIGSDSGDKIPSGLTSSSLSHRRYSEGVAVNANSGSSARQNKRNEKDINKALQSYSLKKESFGTEGDHGRGKDGKSGGLRYENEGRKKRFNAPKNYRRSNSAPDPDYSSDLILGRNSSLSDSSSSCSCSSAVTESPSDVSLTVEEEEEGEEDEERDAATGVKHSNGGKYQESLETSTRSIQSTPKSCLKEPKFSQRRRASIHFDSMETVKPARRVSSRDNLNKSLNGSISWNHSVQTFRASIDSSRVEEEVFYVDDDDLFREYAPDVMDKNSSQKKSSATTSSSDANANKKWANSPAQRRSSAPDNRRKHLVRDESGKIEYFEDEAVSSNMGGSAVRRHHTSVLRADAFYGSLKNSLKGTKCDIDKIMMRGKDEKKDGIDVNSKIKQDRVRGSSRRQSTNSINMMNSWSGADVDGEPENKIEQDANTATSKPVESKSSRRQSANSILNEMPSPNIHEKSFNTSEDAALRSDRRKNSRRKSANDMGNNLTSNDNNSSDNNFSASLTTNQHEAALRSSMAHFNALALKRESNISTVRVTNSGSKLNEKRGSILTDATELTFSSESDLSLNFVVSPSGNGERRRLSGRVAINKDDSENEGKSAELDRSHYLKKISSILYLE